MIERGVGFTGTQRGLTAPQLQSLRALLRMPVRFRAADDVPFRHGDCVGADAEAHAAAVEFGYPVIVHPPSDPRKRAFCSPAHRVEEPEEYLKRNRRIVDASRILIACPRRPVEEVRSGTWATIRYARQVGVPTILVMPNGTCRFTGRTAS